MGRIEHDMLHVRTVATERSRAALTVTELDVDRRAVSTSSRDGKPGGDERLPDPTLASHEHGGRERHVRPTSWRVLLRTHCREHGARLPSRKSEATMNQMISDRATRSVLDEAPPRFELGVETVVPLGKRRLEAREPIQGSRQRLC